MNKYSDVMAKHSDEKLVDLLNNHREEYQPEAIEAMIEEAKKRGLQERVFMLEEPKVEENESVYDIAIREIMQLERNIGKN